MVSHLPINATISSHTVWQQIFSCEQKHNYKTSQRTDECVLDDGSNWTAACAAEYFWWFGFLQTPCRCHHHHHHQPTPPPPSSSSSAAALDSTSCVQIVFVLHSPTHCEKLVLINFAHFKWWCWVISVTKRLADLIPSLSLNKHSLHIAILCGQQALLCHSCKSDLIIIKWG